MDRLTNVCEKLDKLKNISGKNDKQTYIKENRDDTDFLDMLNIRVNPFIQLKVKTLPPFDYALAEHISLTYEVFKQLLDDLASGNINAAMRLRVADTLSSGNYKYSEILEGMVTKKLNLGVDTAVNKALGYEFIPTFDVMLAAPLKDGVEVPIPCQADLKYDGVRCTAIVENSKCNLFTRQGRKMHFPLIEKEIEQLAGPEDMTFDGELEMASRTGISGVCNSNLKTGYVGGSDNHIEYYIFDEIPTRIFKAKGVTEIQSVRSMNLAKRFANTPQLKRVRLGETQTIHSKEKLQAVSNNYIANGFEGIIAKDPNAVYHYKRNKAWLKLKAINSVTLKVVATETGKGKRKGKVGALVCESDDGMIQVNVGGGFSDDDIDTFTKAPPIGKYIEVLYNVLIKGRSSDTYSLFLPRFKEMRIDKDATDTIEKVKAEHIGAIEE